MAKKLNITYIGGTDWLAPFTKEASKVINLRRLKKVKGFKVPLNRVEVCRACCHIKDDNTFTITLSTHVHDIKKIGVRAKKFLNRKVTHMLYDYAHELAHIPHWKDDINHSPEHFETEAILNLRFARLLKKWKIKDVETRVLPVPGGKK